MESNDHQESEEQNEFILYQDENRNEEERIENSGSDLEQITDEEYMLEFKKQHRSS